MTLSAENTPQVIVMVAFSAKNTPQTMMFSCKKIHHRLYATLFLLTAMPYKKSGSNNVFNVKPKWKHPNYPQCPILDA